jgi:hypothetical protein
MAKKEYAGKWKDPRWQKKRLEIFERDEWTCRFCGEKEETLAVHHLYYEKNKDPWEYDTGALITLCQICHESEHEFRKESETFVLEMLERCGVGHNSVHTLGEVLWYMLERGVIGEKAVAFFSALRWAFTSGAFAESLVAAHRQYREERREEREAERGKSGDTKEGQ